MKYGNPDYTEKSDVWSYGVTLWEIFTFGEIPYNELENLKVKPAILQGTKLQIREEFPENARTLMRLCWLEACERPLFKDIVTHLTHVKKDEEVNNCRICQNVNATPNPIAKRDLKEKLIPVLIGFVIFITIIVIANGVSIGKPQSFISPVS